MAKSTLDKAIDKAFNPYWPELPHAKQFQALCMFDQRDLFLGGSKGPGKTSFQLMNATQFYDHPQSHSLIICRTFKQLERENGPLDRATRWWKDNRDVAWDGLNKRFRWKSGASVTFGHCEHSTAHLDYESSEFTSIGVDEAQEIPELQLRYFSTDRLRRPADSDIPLRFRLTGTPGGISHNYLKSEFVQRADEGRFIAATVFDNAVGIDVDEYVRGFKDNHTAVNYARYIEGDWDIAPEGLLFNAEMFDDRYEPSHIAYDQIRWVRSWDTAGTEEKKRNDPDWTVGAKVGVLDGKFYIDNIIRFRGRPSQVKNTVRRTAEIDGYDTPVLIEYPPGDAGVQSNEEYAVLLAGYAFYGIRPQGTKPVRAEAVSTQAELGNVRLRIAPWNTEFIDEHCLFPTDGVHDDQVDAVSQAVRYLGGGTRGDDAWAL